MARLVRDGKLTTPDFASRDFLLDHARDILSFYRPRARDASGGFFQNYYDDGRLFSPGQRHLVSSCRMVFNFCNAYALFGEADDLALAQHGWDYVRERHWSATRNGYHWTLSEGHAPDDQTNHCYGLAFVMLAAASAKTQGLAGADAVIEQTWEILQRHFWDEQGQLYADEATPDWSVISEYRGQNANMHCCEALLAAHGATGESRYLDRAYLLAHRITVDLAGLSDGLIWEHYTGELEIDWDYNKDDPKNLYRPWGFQPGHQTEWSKLLLLLHAVRPEPWMVARAADLYRRAVDRCWDSQRGGIYYGFAPDGQICDDDKYFWVQAETFAAAARLFVQTGDDYFKRSYQSIWEYCWAHMIDHDHGAWYRVLRADNSKYSSEKSAAGAKCDYHSFGACLDVLNSGLC